MLVKRIAIINGKPRSGKDTLISFVSERLKQLNVHCYAISTIDPVRDMLRERGFPVDKKGPAERKLLADVGAAVEEYNGWRTTRALKTMVEHAWGHEHDHENVVGFIQLRECANIERLKKRAEAERFAVTRVLVRSPLAEEADNVADNDVDNMPYDVLIHNRGSLDELRTGAHDLAVLLHTPNYKGM